MSNPTDMAVIFLGSFWWLLYMDALMESSLVSPQGSSTGQGASDAQRLQLQEASVPTVPWKMRRVPQYATGCHGMPRPWLCLFHVHFFFGSGKMSIIMVTGNVLWGVTQIMFPKRHER